MTNEQETDDDGGMCKLQEKKINKHEKTQEYIRSSLQSQLIEHFLPLFLNFARSMSDGFSSLFVSCILS